jgi:succinate dehydrogenase / fumarate reductase cytochrome b subunit
VSWLVKTFSTHSGRKAIAALTGLGLVLFLVVHLLGNLLIYSKGNALNEYAHALHSGPLIILGDVGLLIMFPLHVAMVVWLARDNAKARGAQGYKVTGTKQKRSFASVLASKTTLYGGILLLFFVVVHVWHFRLQHDAISQGTFSASVAPGDLKMAIIETLSKPHWGILYILGSLITGWHLFHGIQAAFRSMGAYHPRYTPIIVKAGAGLAAVIALGFAAIPVWIFVA